MLVMILFSALAAAGIVFLLWCFAAAVLCPVPPGGSLIYAVTPERSGELEQAVRGFSFLRSNGILRADLVIVLGHVSSETERMAELLAQQDCHITLVQQEQWPKWLESEA